MPPRDVSMTRGGRELHLAIMATPLRREDGGSDGVVIVFDDVTPLIRAQKVAAWREVARRLAHEIKNPLTPIQLSAERMRRHLSSAPEPTHSAGRGVHRHDRRRGRVAQGARRRVLAVRAHAGAARVPTDLHELLNDVLSLYQGIFTDVDIRPRFAASLPKVSVDPEQIRRVMINLVDNAIEAMERRGTIDIETQHDPSNNLVRIIVADDGPGHSGVGARQAVSAVLLDQAARQRPRSRHRPPHRRRARRQHRPDGQRPARDTVCH